MKNTYFLSDAHLGSRAVPHCRTQERRIVNFLDNIKERAEAIYLLGDIFDFWYEYKMVVPKGYTRFLGKLSELTDRGVEIHFFTGNHDIWCGDYLEKECGLVMHREPQTVELHGKEFYLAHGDECFVKFDKKYAFLHALFHNRLAQTLFSAVHPRWSIDLGLAWAEYSLMSHKTMRPVLPFQGEDKEPIVIFSKNYLATHPSINYFIFGHRHVLFDLMLDKNSRLISMGDWLSSFAYLVFDGNHLFTEQYIEGESKP